MVKPSSPELARSGHTPVDPDAPSTTAPLQPHVDHAGGDGMGPVPPDNRPGRREAHPQDKPDLDAFAEHFRRHDESAGGGEGDEVPGDEPADAAFEPGDVRGHSGGSVVGAAAPLGFLASEDGDLLGVEDDVVDLHGVLGDPVEPSAHQLAVAARRRGPARRAVRAACRVPVRAAAIGLTVTDASLAVSRLTVHMLRSRLRNAERW